MQQALSHAWGGLGFAEPAPAPGKSHFCFLQQEPPLGAALDLLPLSIVSIGGFICSPMSAMHTPHFCTSLCLKKNSNKLEVYTIRLSFNERCMVSSLKGGATLNARAVY